MFRRLENTPSLEVYYPYTDYDTSSSEGEFELVRELDRSLGDDIDRDGLIEITLDSGEDSARKSDEEDLHVEEEDNLIEINISDDEDYDYTCGNDYEGQGFDHFSTFDMRISISNGRVVFCPKLTIITSMYVG